MEKKEDEMQCDFDSVAKKYGCKIENGEFEIPYEIDHEIFVLIMCHYHCVKKIYENQIYFFNLIKKSAEESESIESFTRILNRFEFLKNGTLKIL